MTPDSRGVPFPCFDPRGREFDQPLERRRDRARSPGGYPERLPSFVGLPVVAGIEEPEGMTKLATLLPPRGVEGCHRLRLLAIAVPGRIDYRMGKPSRHVAIGG